ncbi:hypothetical protein AVO45_02030 [Ruegeria marisrubri]|uniref:DUF3306 domain-containing protein n=1 Tax=Ruegeria marisrubri TaxID=1685379 RepID=A0A117KH55_9RHOB|nr:DUF3306 domain-containing protein [Ruegeria marisrubri]KUJ85784.1 hypothetical protein AVO45_02030 [Ruegeria marisrubri]
MNKPRDFWSRRKAAVQAETEAEHAALEAQEIAQQQAELEDKTDAEILAELDLPDPDDLKPGDDVSGFMARAVPERIRQRALRRLWRLNPVLANVDGLVDYGEDYTDAACVVETLQTAYQVGKGMLAHVEALAAAEDAPDEETTDAEDEAPVAEAAPEPDMPPAAAVAQSAPVDEHDEPEMPPAPRRMRFEFEG